MNRAAYRCSGDVRLKVRSLAEEVPRQRLEADCVGAAQDQSANQAAATLQADQRNKKIKDEDKAKDWQDQQPTKKKDKKDT